MSVLDWSPEKRILVEVRKALNGAPRAGRSTNFATLFPTVLPDDLEVGQGESICAEIRNKHGRRFYFTERGMYVETDGFFAHLPYESIVTCDWIDDDPDLMVKARKKQEHGDRLILHDSERKRYELDGLGSAFQGMYTFFHWLK
jgi:hypothetical protein